MSSACLMAMLTRIELMEPSMRTFSFSLRLITTGVSSNSLLLLQYGEVQGKNELESRQEPVSKFQVHSAGRCSMQEQEPCQIFQTVNMGKNSSKMCYSFILVLSEFNGKLCTYIKTRNKIHKYFLASYFVWYYYYAISITGFTVNMGSGSQVHHLQQAQPTIALTKKWWVRC